ncbi:hypothetical protein ACFQBY_03210 [Promicromonospora citrea]|uniref:hypothetical protein n=1 Tax=Promicromonospora citrea TaxID=43677 RepID=UPI001667DECA|nr:hypothetical protein [Promicromonospora citrea]
MVRARRELGDGRVGRVEAGGGGPAVDGEVGDGRGLTQVVLRGAMTIRILLMVLLLE